MNNDDGHITIRALQRFAAEKCARSEQADMLFYTLAVANLYGMDIEKWIPI